MQRTETPRETRWAIVAAVAAGVAVRLLVATRGHNFDLDSFRTVAEIVVRGDNVHAHTSLYNYGPVWSWFLAAFRAVSGESFVLFRFLVAGFLSLVDVGIFFVLYRSFGRRAALVFLFHPVSVVISGYHGQFDNLAVLLALGAISLLGDGGADRQPGWRGLAGLLLLGCSLATKHVFFAFPFWLAVRQKSLRAAGVVLLVPFSVFVAAFLPYWSEGHAGIVGNVLRYESRNQEYLYRMLVPDGLALLSGRSFWLLLLVLFAFAYRKRSTRESLLAYTAVLVAASPSTANQYLSIPVPFLATQVDVFSALYAIVGTWHVMVDADGLHVGFGVGRDLQYSALVALLSLALAWSTWRDDLLRAGRRLRLALRPRSDAPREP